MSKEYEYLATLTTGHILDAKDEYEEAENDVDRETWEREIERLENVRHIYEQAAKADEYEAKAKAFDEIMKVFENNFGAADSLAKLKVFTEVENAYIESGESDA